MVAGINSTGSRIERCDAERTPLIEQLGRAFDAVADLIGNIRTDQWSAPTPCADWTVRRVVTHLIGMNLDEVERFYTEHDLWITLR